MESKIVFFVAQLVFLWKKVGVWQASACHSVYTVDGPKKIIQWRGLLKGQKQMTAPRTLKAWWREINH